MALISAAQSEAVCPAFCNVMPGLAMRCLTDWMKLCLTSAFDENALLYRLCLTVDCADSQLKVRRSA